jgi:hypothetical protein
MEQSKVLEINDIGKGIEVFDLKLSKVVMFHVILIIMYTLFCLI